MTEQTTCFAYIDATLSFFHTILTAWSSKLNYLFNWPLLVHEQ